VHPRLDRAAADEVELVAHVDAVGAGVLRNHQQFLHALLDQVLGFAHHLADRSADEIAAHRRDDAEAAAVVAALRDLQVGIVLRRQLDAGRRHQVTERVVRLRQVAVDVVEHFAGRMRAGDGEDLRMHAGNQVPATLALGAEAAGDDDLAVLGERLADRLERFLDGGVDEAAGVDDDEVGVLVGRARRIAFGPQLREDEFGVDQRLRAAERHEADRRRGRGRHLARPPRGRRGGHRFGKRTISWCRPGNRGTR
jgi:hypothetical protein